MLLPSPYRSPAGGVVIPEDTYLSPRTPGGRTPGGRTPPDLPLDQNGLPVQPPQQSLPRPSQQQQYTNTPYGYAQTSPPLSDDRTSDDWIMGPWPSSGPGGGGGRGDGNAPGYGGGRGDGHGRGDSYGGDPRAGYGGGGDRGGGYDRGYGGHARNPSAPEFPYQTPFSGYPNAPLPSPGYPGAHAPLGQEWGDRMPGGWGGGAPTPGHAHRPLDHFGGAPMPGYTPAYGNIPLAGPNTPYLGADMGRMPGGPMPGGMPGGMPQFGGFPGLPRRNTLSRPKEEELVISKWASGPDYGIVLNPTKIAIMKPTIQLHPLLGGSNDPKAPALVFDLLFPTSRIHLSTEHPSRSWMGGRHDPATFPRVDFLRIISPHVPWTVEVRNPDGVTCGDVCERLYAKFNELVARPEWETVPPEYKKEVTLAYKKNRSTEPGYPGGMMGAGIKRVDFLGERTMFGGAQIDDEFVKERVGSGLGVCIVLNLEARAE